MKTIIQTMDMAKCTLLLLIFVTEFGFAQKVQQLDFEKAPVVQWKFKIKQPVFSSPVISDGTVYVAGLDSTLYALELSTGNVNGN
jgi:outer membrane protein assembly factor BamB